MVPGYQDEVDDEALKAAAASIGYPLLVKATAGGGGKGMRLVTSEDVAESHTIKSAKPRRLRSRT